MQTTAYGGTSCCGQTAAPVISSPTPAPQTFEGSHGSSMSPSLPYCTAGS